MTIIPLSYDDSYRIIRIGMHNRVKVSNKRTELINTSHDQDGFNYKQSVDTHLKAYQRLETINF